MNTISTTSVLQLVVGTNDLLLHNLVDQLGMLEQVVVLLYRSQVPLQHPTASVKLLSDQDLGLAVYLSVYSS